MVPSVSPSSGADKAACSSDAQPCLAGPCRTAVAAAAAAPSSHELSRPADVGTALQTDIDLQVTSSAIASAAEANMAMAHFSAGSGRLNLKSIAAAAAMAASLLVIPALSASAAAAAELDYSRDNPRYDGYNYEQYLYDRGEGESQNNWPNMYGDGYQRPNNQGSSSYEYGRDRYYGQQGVRCPENDGRGHHRPHPGCPEYNRPGAGERPYPPSYGHRPYQPSYGERPYPPSYGERPYPPPSYYPQHPRPPHGQPAYPSYPDYGRPDINRPDYRPNNPALKGSINACLAFEQPDGTWSIDRPVKVDIVDGMTLYETLGISPDRNYNYLYVVFNGFSHSYRDNVILPLKHRRSLSSAAIVLQDLQGRSWRISSSWRRCTR